MASPAYAEQEGTKRQHGPIKGETVTRYSQTAPSNSLDTNRERNPAHRTGIIDSFLFMDTQRLAQLLNDVSILRLCGQAPSDDQYIFGRNDSVLVTTEKLPDQTLHPVTQHRSSNAAARRDAEPRGPARPGRSDHHEPHPGVAAPNPLQGKKFSALADAPCPWQPLVNNGRRCQRGCLGGMLTVNRLRPLARRRFNTCRPPGLLMRARNPCVRLRRLLLG
jgi:hypothetical protein